MTSMRLPESDRLLTQVGIESNRGIADTLGAKGFPVKIFVRIPNYSLTPFYFM